MKKQEITVLASLVAQMITEKNGKRNKQFCRVRGYKCRSRNAGVFDYLHATNKE